MTPKLRKIEIRDNFVKIQDIENPPANMKFNKDWMLSPGDQQLSKCLLASLSLFPVLEILTGVKARKVE